MDNDNLIQLLETEQYFLEHWLTRAMLNSEEETKLAKQMDKRCGWINDKLKELYELQAR